MHKPEAGSPDTGSGFRLLALNEDRVGMGCLGVHFALSQIDYERVVLASSVGDDVLLMLIQEDIEKRAWRRARRQPSDPWRCETDRSWDAIHRCLTDGKLGWANGEYPLKLCIFGGEQLYAGDDYVVALILSHEVKDLARALKQVTKKWMRARYDAIDPKIMTLGCAWAKKIGNTLGPFSRS